MYIRSIIYIAVFMTIGSFANAVTVFDSAAEYSTTQGQDNWYYGYYDGDSDDPYTTSDFEEFPEITTGGGWIIHRGDPTGYWTSMGRYGGHPNGPVRNYYQGTEHWTVRRWISDVAGKISVEGLLSKSSTIGDGTICSITVNDNEVYSKHIYGTEGDGVEYLIEIDINVGDIVDFAIQPGNNDLYDSTRFTAIGTLLSSVELPVITFEQPLNTNECIEATSPEGALVTAYVDGFIDATNIVYSWSNTDGVTTTGPVFDFQLGLNKSTIVFLTIMDLQTGDEASSFEQVRVCDTTAPFIEILDPQAGDSFNGNNLFLDVLILDAVDTNIVDYTVHVGTSTTGFLDPETGISRVHLFKPETADAPTDITVVAKDASGNTSEETVQVFLQHDNRKK